MPGYRKLARIAVGGQATVHRGVNVDTEEEVALKYLKLRGKTKPDPAQARNMKARFVREVKEQRRLDHPNIMPVLDYSETHSPWYAMPMAQASLQDFLDAEKRDVGWCLDVLSKVIDGMEYAHKQGVIHRDLKPNNILLVDGKWVVSDFGFCLNINSESLRITEAENLVGTYVYAAPEQYDDAHLVGPTADVYSIGKMLIHCLAWNMPPPGGNRLSEIPLVFKSVVIRCVAEDPSDRFQSLSDLRDALRDAFENFKEG